MSKASEVCIVFHALFAFVSFIHKCQCNFFVGQWDRFSTREMYAHIRKCSLCILIRLKLRVSNVANAHVWQTWCSANGWKAQWATRVRRKLSFVRLSACTGVGDPSVRRKKMNMWVSHYRCCAGSHSHLSHKMRQSGLRRTVPWLRVIPVVRISYWTLNISNFKKVRYFFLILSTCAMNRLDIWTSRPW